MFRFTTKIVVAVTAVWIMHPVLAQTTHHHSVNKHHKVHHHAQKHVHGHHHYSSLSRHHLRKAQYQGSSQLSDFVPSTDCRDPALPDTTDIVQSSTTTTLADSVKKQLVDFVDKTVATLQYSSYKLGGKRFDPARGVYVLDCSGFVDHVLQETSPHAYSSLVSATGADAPASQHYYNFFTELSADPDSYWNKVENVNDLRAGDILVFRYKNRRGTETGGHVMVVMDKPLRNEEVFLVRVADSAPSGHSEDTRPGNTSGIGIGTLLLKANTRTGQPAAFAWGLGGYWNKNVSIAMARPMDVG